MKKTTIFLELIIAMFFFSCSRKNTDWHGGVIKDFGTYHASQKKYTIEVYDHDGILNYYVKKINGERIIPGPRFGASTYQTWAMYFDKNKDLWIQSADIGASLWKYVGPDEYKEIDLSKERRYLDSMPKDLKYR